MIAFVWNNWGKSRKISFRILCLRADNWYANFMNKKLGFYSSNRDVRPVHWNLESWLNTETLRATITIIQQISYLLPSKGFWRRWMILGITGYLDIVSRPVSETGSLLVLKRASPVSQTLCSLVFFRIPDNGKCPETQQSLDTSF
jgi:hypothetical protein